MVEGGDADLSTFLRPGLTKIFHLADRGGLSASDRGAGLRNLPAISMALFSPSRLLRRESGSGELAVLSRGLLVGLSAAEVGIPGYLNRFTGADGNSTTDNNAERGLRVASSSSSLPSKLVSDPFENIVSGLDAVLFFREDFRRWEYSGTFGIGTGSTPCGRYGWYNGKGLRTTPADGGCSQEGILKFRGLASANA